MRESTSNRFEYHYPVLILLMQVVALVSLTETRGPVYADSDPALSAHQTIDQESPQTDVREIKMGEPIERQLGGGDAHSYRVILGPGKFMKILVEQRSVDLKVKLFGPAGVTLSAVDNVSMPGVETIFTVADESGPYRIEVQSSVKDAKPGKYEIRIEELREATSRDRNRVAAQKVFEEANQLREQQTAESRRKAIQKYEETLPMWRETGDRSGEANTLSQIGRLYALLSEKQKALEYYGQALTLYRAIEDRHHEANTLTNMADVHLQLGEMQKALEFLDQALPLSRAVKDRKIEASTLNNMGQVYSRLDKPQQALEYLNQALLLKREIGDRLEEAYTLNNIGAVYDSLGELQKTLEYYDQAVPLLRAVGDSDGQAGIFNNIGYTYFRLGEFPKALDYYGQSLRMLRVTGNRFGEGYVLDNMGKVYNRLGEPQKALESYLQALEIRRAIADRPGQATTLHNIGTIYVGLGEPRRALEYFEQALSLKPEKGDQREEAFTLDSIGAIYVSLGELQKGLDYHNQSLTIRRAVNDRYGEAYALTNVGMAYYQLDKLKEALDSLNQALQLRRSMGDRSGIATTLHYIGLTHIKLREPDKAVEHYTEALSLVRALGVRRDEAPILLGAARAERDRGNVVEARRLVEAALKSIESTRSKVASQGLRSSYLASMQDYYSFYIDLLMQMNRTQPPAGYDAAAYSASERARARGLLELLTEARIDVKQGIAPDLKQREKDVQSRISKTQNDLIQASSSAKRDQTKVAALEEAFKKLENEREQIEIEIRQKHPRYATLHYPTPLELTAVQKSLDENTVLLAYSLGKEASYLFAITQKDFFTARLPAASVITSQVSALRNAVAIKPDRTALSNYLQNARSLYRDLVQPAGKLLNGKRALIIIPDGILHYLPFESLLQTDKSPNLQVDLRQLPYMIRDFTISYAPSATVLASLRKGRATRARDKSLLAFGDPIYEQKGFEQTASIRSALRGGFGESKPWELKQLPESRHEVERIAKLYAPAQASVFLGESAREENVKVAGAPGYRFVHFAVHGLLNEKQPQYSGLVLSLSRIKKEAKAEATPLSNNNTDQNNRSAVVEDGLLQVYEIFDLKLDADLVVLSACETGLGKETRGEGLVGMTQAFLYAGTPSVAVSLWKVEDKSTSDLMFRLYRHLNNPKLNRADALRRAQLEMISTGDFSHPYYWAGFVLIGQP